MTLSIEPGTGLSVIVAEISGAFSARLSVRPMGFSKHRLRVPTLRLRPCGEILRSPGRG